jgi:hypothetical protein
MHETEIKSTRSQSATIVHNQVDASKLNKKSSKCDKEDIIVNQKTRILYLENEIKQLKNVVDTMYIKSDRPQCCHHERKYRWSSASNISPS